MCPVGPGQSLAATGFPSQKRRARILVSWGQQSFLARKINLGFFESENVPPPYEPHPGPIAELNATGVR